MARPGKAKARSSRSNEILRAEVSDVRQIATILKTVDIHSETKSIVTVQEDGLSFSVEVGQTVLARAHLHHINNFRKYNYNPPDISLLNDEETLDEEPSTGRIFEISLTAFLNCINIFGDSTVKPISAKQAAAREQWKKRQRREDEDQRGGRYGQDREDMNDDDDEGERWGNRPPSISSKKKTATAMQLSWEAEGCPLVLMLEDNGIVTRCEITTFDARQIIDLPYDDSERMQKLILASTWLSEAFAEIDTSSERVRLRFAPPASQTAGHAQTTTDNEEDEDESNYDISRVSRGKAAFAIDAKGSNGSVSMEYPFTREVLELCECDRNVRNSYKLSHLSCIRAALSYSSKVSLRTDISGVLCCQFLIDSPDGKGNEQPGFVEFTAGYFQDFPRSQAYRLKLQIMPLNDDD